MTDDDDDDVWPPPRTISPKRRREIIEKIAKLVADGKAYYTIHDGKPAVRLIRKSKEADK
jgi:hypothetical protein